MLEECHRQPGAPAHHPGGIRFGRSLSSTGNMRSVRSHEVNDLQPWSSIVHGPSEGNLWEPLSEVDHSVEREAVAELETLMARIGVLARPMGPNMDDG